MNGEGEYHNTDYAKHKYRDYELCTENCDAIMNNAVCTTAMNVEAKAIIAYTNTGNTARMVSQFRPE